MNPISTDLENTDKDYVEDNRNAWSLAGFEIFDLLVIGIQALIYVTSISVDQLLNHPLYRFALGIGFVATIVTLGRTRVYARGVQQIESEHSYLWAVIYIGGMVLGVLVLTFYIFGPIKTALDAVGVDSSWLSIPGVPLSIVALAFLPYMAIRVEKSNLDEDRHFARYPISVHYAGRATLLLLANSIMHSVYHEMTDGNAVAETISGIGVMLLFYIPVRFQEMFLRPDGPHFQSLIQTILVLGFGSWGALMI